MYLNNPAASPLYNVVVRDPNPFGCFTFVIATFAAIVAAVTMLAMTLLLTSCGGGGEGRLKARSLEYYNYLTGSNDLTEEAFVSPARQKSLTGEARVAMRKAAKVLHEARRNIQKQAGVEPVRIESGIVNVKVAGRFGVTAITERIPVEAVRRQVRWVRDRGRWYLYTGMDAEVEAYGDFPEDLGFESTPPQESVPAAGNATPSPDK